MNSPRPAGTATISAAALAAVLLACAAAYPIVLSGRIGVFGDNLAFWAPNTAFWTAEVQAHRLPLWNPYILGGVPYAADINHGLFYPPHWLALILGVPSATGLLTVAHIALAIFGMYLFISSLDLGPAPAVWGASLFGLCEGFISLGNHLVMLESMSYAGLILYLTVRLVDGGGVRTALCLGAAFAASALAGDVHAAYITVLAAVTIFVVRAVRRVLSGEPGKAAKAAGLGLLGALTAVALASVAVLPAYQLMSFTVRGDGSEAYAAYHSMDPAAVAGVVAPGFWGTPSAGTVWNFRWGNAAYVGIAVFGLALASLRKPGRCAEGACLALCGLVLAFGAHSPIWRLARFVVPGFRLFRQPREYFIITTIGLLILAAYSLSDLASAAARKRTVRSRTPYITGLIALIVVGAALWFFRDRAVAWAAVRIGSKYGAGAPAVSAAVFAAAAKVFALGAFCLAGLMLWRSQVVTARSAALLIGLAVLFDYAALASRQIVYGPRRLYGDGRPPATAAQRAPVRIVPLANGFGEYFQAFASRNITGQMPDEDEFFEKLKAVKSCLPDNEAIYRREPSVLGYSTFIPKRYAALYEAAGGAASSVVRLKPAQGADYRILGADVALEPVESGCTSSIIEGARAGAWPAYDWRSAGGFEEALRMLKTEPARCLASPVVEGLPGSLSPPENPSARFSIEWEDSSVPGVISVDMFTDEGCLLVVEQNNYPGWRAEVNGVAAPIYTANLTFMAVHVPPGKFKVRFRFSPAIVWWGASLSFFSLAVVLLVLSGAVRRRPK